MVEDDCVRRFFATDSSSYSLIKVPITIARARIPMSKILSFMFNWRFVRGD
jgi:hypothetical protein